MAPRLSVTPARRGCARTHIIDVIDLIRYEDLHDVVPVWHSYAGAVAGVTGPRVISFRFECLRL
ncbi:hypothetical protein GCM10022420_062750 [Streptomyces iranensis]